MSNKAAFEALDTTLKDIRENSSIMGGVTFVMWPGTSGRPFQSSLMELAQMRSGHASSPLTYGDM